jgi:hypothetical protein
VEERSEGRRGPRVGLRAHPRLNGL